jgi:hypothetical protein
LNVLGHGITIGLALVPTEEVQIIAHGQLEYVVEEVDEPILVSWQEQRFSWLMELRRISKISRCEKRLLPTMKSSR